MTEKQEHLLQLFREIDEICKENNLRYVMAGGTAIGVVRNEGFIPWDDDVDIYMPRADWEKLVELSEAVLPENRVSELYQYLPKICIYRQLRPSQASDHRKGQCRGNH